MTSGVETLRYALRRSLPIIVGLVLLGVIAVNALTRLQGAQYQATAQVEISATPLSSIVTGTAPPFVDPQRVQDSAQVLAGSLQVYQLARRTGGLSKSATDIRSATSVTAVPDTDILQFDTSSSKPGDAIRTVNSVTRAYVAFRTQVAGTAIADAISKLQSTLGSLTATSPQRPQLQQELARLQLLQGANSSDAVVVQRAETATQTSPAPAKDTVLGFSIGLVIALLVVAVREAIDTTVRSEADVEEMLGAPVVATVSTLPRRTRIVTIGAHEGEYGDTYALLAAQLAGGGLDGGAAKVIAVTSALASEGKTTTATNLAVAAARRGLDVILADFDFRKPTVGRAFGVRRDAEGVLQVLDGTAHDLEALLWRIPLDSKTPTALAPPTRDGIGPVTSERGIDEPHGRLWLLPSGGTTTSRAEQSSAMAAIFRLLKMRANLVILDTPPALLTVEMTELSRLIDSVLVVVRQGRVSRRTLRSLGRRAEAWPSEIAGAVLTDVPRAVGSGYGRYYGER